MKIAKTAKLRKTDDYAKAMAGFVANFPTIEDALAFEDSILSASKVHLPPCALSVRDGGQPTELYWRWLNILAEVWS